GCGGTCTCLSGFGCNAGLCTGICAQCTSTSDNCAGGVCHCGLAGPCPSTDVCVQGNCVRTCAAGCDGNLSDGCNQGLCSCGSSFACTGGTSGQTCSPDAGCIPDPCLGACPTAC